MDEETLVKDCVSGNAKAQRLLFETYSPKMMGVSLRYMRNVPGAEDVLQNGFIKVFNNLKNFDNRGSLEGWIRRIIVNTALDEIRKNKKRQNNIDITESEYLTPQNDFILEGLMAEDLMKLIHTLPDGYRTVFNLFAIEGYSHKEIAEQLGVTENTSKSQYSRAKGYLRKLLEEHNIER